MRYFIVTGIKLLSLPFHKTRDLTRAHLPGFWGSFQVVQRTTAAIVKFIPEAAAASSILHYKKEFTIVFSALYLVIL